ncbi:HVA22-like protein j isoform X1 [Carica papaya]|uniref:HVA22-like protein j isoform X1 n=1 Tax=Carica papaya TaxID=3649 RepID=UPI000B8CC85C|nr:HVA22-like protein j isoform X1 [Carica papaya]
MINFFVSITCYQHLLELGYACLYLFIYTHITIKPCVFSFARCVTCIHHESGFVLKALNLCYQFCRILVAFLTVFERIVDIFVSWLPMYGEMKVAFFIYLWYPKTRGTGYVYETLLRPYVAKHETDIDRKILELRARAWDFFIQYWQNCTQLGQSTLVQIFQQLIAQSTKFTTSNNQVF